MFYMGRRGRSIGPLTIESPNLSMFHIFRIRIYDLNNMLYDSMSNFAYINFMFLNFNLLE